MATGSGEPIYDACPGCGSPVPGRLQADDEGHCATCAGVEGCVMDDEDEEPVGYGAD